MTTIAAIASTLSLALAPASPTGAIAAARHTRSRPPRAHVPVTAEDRASTHAYLVADDTYAHALVAAAPAAQAAVQALARKLEAECPGVLAHLPSEAEGGASGPGAASKGFWRAVGEAKRRDEQLSDLEEELGRAELGALLGADRPAIEAFIPTVAPLRFTDPELREDIHGRVADLEEDLHWQTPAVCADMSAWAKSGFTTLSPASRALVQAREARSHAGPPVAPRSTPPRPPRRPRRPRTLGQLLAPYEDASDKALIKDLAALDREYRATLVPIEATYRALNAALGIHEAGEPAASRTKPEKPPPGTVKLGHGRTAVGRRFIVWATSRRSHPPGSDGGCAHEVDATEGTGSAGRSRGPGVSYGECVPARHASAPHVSCEGGYLTVEALTLASARVARLRLSDGHTISSRPVRIPRSAGGPAGFYYQVVRGPKPIPTALEEIGAHGSVVKRVRLRRVVECRKDPLRFLPGGLGPIARGAVPGGPRFTIIGEHYRFLGRDHFAMAVEMEDGSGGGESESGRKPKLWSWAAQAGCQPRPYAIVYGLLTAPHDTVLARIDGRLRPLRRMRIPKRFGAHGELAYIAAGSMPTEILVRGPSGRTLVREDTRGRAQMEREICEGEAEGTRP